MSLREQDARNHPWVGGLVVHVARDLDAIIVPGAQDTVIMVMVRQGDLYLPEGILSESE